MENLKELVAIRSDKDCDQIIEFIKNKLESKVKQVEIFEENGIKILIAGINTKLLNINPIVLSGHIDTVSANEELYLTNPYELTEKDGKVYGLGTIDMKSFTAIILDNLDELASYIVPIILVLTTDEETKLDSITFAIKKLKELNIKPQFTILGEPTKSEFNVVSNSCYGYSAEFFGKACHSSKIGEGINAVCACSKLVSFIERRQKKYNLTSNCGVFSGGEVVNKVPDFAKILFDIRSIYPADVKDFIKDIQRYIIKLQKQYPGLSYKLTNKLSIPALNMSNNKTIKKIAEELGVAVSKFSGGCEAGYYTDYSGDAVIFGVGDLSLAHKPNEYAVIEEYYNYSKKLLNLLNIVQKYYFNKL